jgi:uncharacterized protein (DUF4415 family)
MSEEDMKKTSGSDWERVDGMGDNDINTKDIPPLDEEFFAKAELRMPKKKIPVTMRVDPEVLYWFKSFGKGYQTRMNAVLRTYMEAYSKRTPTG